MIWQLLQVRHLHDHRHHPRASRALAGGTGQDGMSMAAWRGARPRRGALGASRSVEHRVPPLRRGVFSDPSSRLYPAPMPLEFGVFQGASVGPRPWDVTEPLRIRRDIEVGIAADAAGFDTYWAPEHHCLEEYSHGSSSHLACLAVGVQTKRIRVVTGIFNLCPPINHPVRVAEQIAYIDVRDERARRARHRSRQRQHRGEHLRPLERRDARHVGGGDPRHPADVDAGALLVAGQALLGARALHHAARRAEAAPAALGHRDAIPGTVRARGGDGDRRRDVQLRRPGAAAAARRDLQVHHPEGEAGRRVHLRQDHDDRARASASRTATRRARSTCGTRARRRRT